LGVLGLPLLLCAQVDTSKVQAAPPAPVFVPVDSSLHQTLPGHIPLQDTASVAAQLVDTTRRQAESSPPEQPDERPHWQKLLVAGKRPPYDPKVAWQRSLIFPGWGQIYNKSYWKLPIVYGGYVALGFYYNIQNQRYQDFRRAYLYRVDNDPNTEDTQYAGATNDNVRRARDAARRQRDYAILYIAGFHLFQVVEAFVDAHLKNFDVSEDLSFRGEPGSIELHLPGNQVQHIPGISLSIGF
ncbi:MAG: hypothetical protein D6730_20895, partial [Bacteroidetes bacterium]